MKAKVLLLSDDSVELELSDFSLVSAPQFKEYWTIRLYLREYGSFFEILESGLILPKRIFYLSELEDYQLRSELRELARRYYPHHCKKCGDKYILENRQWDDNFCSDYCKNEYHNPPVEEEELETKTEEIIEVPIGRFGRILK